MNQCLRITFAMDAPHDFLNDVIKKTARALDLEGFAQIESEQHIKIIACGKKETIEEFLDLLHKKGAKHFLAGVTVEPFIKDKDYRNVFRILE